MSVFTTWLDTYVAEKGLDTEEIYEVHGPSGVNYIPLSGIITAIKAAPSAEQAQIRTKIVRLDFLSKDPKSFFRHLAGALAM